MNGPLFAAQDQLFPAPKPDQSITFIALDQSSLAAVGTLANADHARVITYLTSLHPSVILYDFPLDRQTAPDTEDPKHPINTNTPLVETNTLATRWWRYGMLRPTNPITRCWPRVVRTT